VAKHIKTYEQPQFDEEGKLIVYELIYFYQDHNFLSRKKVNQENPDEEQVN